MQAAGFRLGIDFGTSHTVAVLRWPDGRIRPLLFDGSPMLPSAVYVDLTGRYVVGRDALDSGRLDPSRLEPNPKRRIDDSTILLGDREVSVVDTIAAVLAMVYAEAARIAGTQPAFVTLTCPAAWGTPRRRILLDAAARARLGEVRMVEEPVAAATYFAQMHGMASGDAVIVYDLGGGTFDVSLVEKTAGGFRTRAVDGRDDIGGLDLDEVLIRRIGDLYAAHDRERWQRLLDPTNAQERRYRRLFRDDVRAVKERLSRYPTADLHIPALDRDAHVTREEFEYLARPLLNETVAVTVRVANGFPRERIAGVFLVGGASRIPLVATLVHQAVGIPPTVIEQPELVVAEGSILVQSVVAVTRDPDAPVSPVAPLVLAPPAPAPEPETRKLPASPKPISPQPASPQPASPQSAGKRNRVKWLVGAGVAAAVALAVTIALIVLPDGDEDEVPAVCALTARATGVDAAQPGSPEPPRKFEVAGWTTYTDPTGFRVGYPKDWTRFGTGACFGHRGEGRFVGVSQWRQTDRDVAAYWRLKESQISDTLTGYRKINIESDPVRTGGAAWEFTFDDAGTEMHVRAIAFVSRGQRGYGYFWATKESVWRNNLVTDYSQLHATFQPAA